MYALTTHRSLLTLVISATVLCSLLCSGSLLAQGTMKQVTSPNLHLGVSGAFTGDGNGGAIAASASFPLLGFLRGMHLELGAAGVFNGDVTHVSLPIAFRYTFLSSGRFAPYLYLGTGYYLDGSDEMDHGFQFLHTGAGAEYYFGETFALGLGFDYHGASLSMKNDGPTNERNWFAYGLRATFAL